MKMLTNRKEKIMKKIFWMIVFLIVSIATAILCPVIWDAILGNPAGMSDTGFAMFTIIGFMVPSVCAIILGVMWIADLKYGTDDENKANK